MFNKLKDKRIYISHIGVTTLKESLKHASSYTEWKEIALKLDEESGREAWKYDNQSPYFDAEILSKHYNLLKNIECSIVL